MQTVATEELQRTDLAELFQPTELPSGRTPQRPGSGPNSFSRPNCLAAELPKQSPLGRTPQRSPSPNFGRPSSYRTLKRPSLSRSPTAGRTPKLNRSPTADRTPKRSSFGFSAVELFSGRALAAYLQPDAYGSRTPSYLPLQEPELRNGHTTKAFNPSFGKLCSHHHQSVHRRR